MLMLLMLEMRQGFRITKAMARITVLSTVRMPPAITDDRRVHFPTGRFVNSQHRLMLVATGKSSSTTSCMSSGLTRQQGQFEKERKSFSIMEKGFGNKVIQVNLGCNCIQCIYYIALALGSKSTT